MTEVVLQGCPFQPLAAYLKALAVFRLVASQADAGARGHWTDEYFILRSSLDRAALIDFFADTYRPTSVVAPWNGGSGFYAKDRKVGLQAIRSSPSARFETYRSDLEIAEGIVKSVGGEKAESAAAEDKRRTEILRECRNRLSDGAVEWLDAAIAISADNSRAFAPILGTGGNEGRLDYTNNFMENVAGLLVKPEKKTPVRPLLENALFGVPVAGLSSISVGQYDPGRSGGFNQGNGIESGAVANPWNAILTLEGAIAWSGGIYRRQGISYRSFLCSPFTVRPSAVGFGSAADKDETSARAEVWTPLWEKPARYGEIRWLLREARAEVGGRPAKNGLEFAQAATSLGVDRAISGFVRYSFLKRRGDSYVALPIGRFPVTYRNAADLIREMTGFVQKAEFAARGGQKEVPNSWLPVRRAIDEAIFQALELETDESLTNIAAAFGAMHQWLLSRGSQMPGKERLSAAWANQLINHERYVVESRLAAALSSLLRHPVAGTLFDNLDPDNNKFAWTGRDLAHRMLATLRRRSQDGQASEKSPFEAAYRARPQDVADFLSGDLDEDLIEKLLYAFLLARIPSRPARPRIGDCRLWPAYCAMKQLFAPESHSGLERANGNVHLKPDLSIPSLLNADRVREATEVAIRRLRVSGFRLSMSQGYDFGEGPRLGAALLIPVSNLEGLRRLIVSDETAEAV